MAMPGTAPQAATMFDECLHALGSDLVAYLLGAGKTAPVSQWRMADAWRTDAGRERIGAAWAVVHYFKDAPHARSWLRDINAGLGRMSPAALIRDARGRADLERVTDAAEAAVTETQDPSTAHRRPALSPDSSAAPRRRSGRRAATAGT
jgi:hypothetical protein